MAIFPWHLHWLCQPQQANLYVDRNRDRRLSRQRNKDAKLAFKELFDSM